VPATLRTSLTVSVFLSAMFVLRIS
jgi:hypothetical protein